MRVFSTGASHAPYVGTLDAEGDIYLGGKGFLPGFDQGPLVCGPIPVSFVAKLDPSGVPIWSRLLRQQDPDPSQYELDSDTDPNGDLYLESMSLSSDGTLAISGGFHGTVDLGFGYVFDHHAWTGFFERLSP
jgi:hypothetical protein